MRLRAWQVVAFAGLAAAVTAMLGGPVDVLPRFVDVTRQAGIHFRHEHAWPQKFMIETMGAGCAWIDYNRDGLLDLYLVNGAETAAFKPAKPLARRFTATTETALSPTSRRRPMWAPRACSAWEWR